MSSAVTKQDIFQHPKLLYWAGVTEREREEKGKEEGEGREKRVRKGRYERRV